MHYVISREHAFLLPLGAIIVSSFGRFINMKTPNIKVEG